MYNGIASAARHIHFNTEFRYEIRKVRFFSIKIMLHAQAQYYKITFARQKLCMFFFKEKFWVYILCNWNNNNMHKSALIDVSSVGLSINLGLDASLLCAMKSFSILVTNGFYGQHKTVTLKNDEIRMVLRQQKKIYFSKIICAPNLSLNWWRWWWFVHDLKHHFDNFACGTEKIIHCLYGNMESGSLFMNWHSLRLLYSLVTKQKCGFTRFITKWNNVNSFAELSLRYKRILLIR